MQLIFEWVEADRGCIMLVNPDSGELEPAVRRNRKGLNSDDRIRISQTILDYVMEHNEGVLTSNARDDYRWNPAVSILQMGVCEAICVPMRGRYNMVGLIYIDTTISAQRIIQQQSTTKFSDEHLKLMIAIAHQAALAVEDTRYYSAMVQAERLAAVGQTIATLSHHIKNILQGIRGGSFLIKEGLSQHDEKMVRKGWEFVEKNQERISHLVMDMLTFSKEREPELVSADMNEVADDVVELMTARAAEKNVELVFTPAEKLPTLVFDPEGLHRAILNVVTNALDACERAAVDAAADDETPIADSDHNAEIRQSRPGRVEVRVEYDREQRQVRIQISDNGQGIPADEIEHVFSLFVSKKGNRGTGLGLPVSQKIIKEHGGRIEVTSQVGEGSTFSLQLPAVFPEQASSGTSVEIKPKKEGS
jgi:two-component system NtrC family sensor kinase